MEPGRWPSDVEPPGVMSLEKMKLKSGAMSDMMSDMKTIAKPAKKKPARARRKPAARREFTVRDLNRNTAELLDAARKHGSVTVRSRAGEQFMVSSKRPSDSIAMPFKERMRRQRELRASQEEPRHEHGPEINLDVVKDFAARQSAYRSQLRALVGKCPSKVDVERINRIIAGEE